MLRVLSSYQKNQKFIIRPVTSSVHQGLILKPTLFKFFINNSDNVMAYALSNLADNTKLEGVADSGCDAIQRDRLESCTGRNLNSSKVKCTFSGKFLVRNNLVSQ